MERLQRFLQGSVHGKLVSFREGRAPHVVMVRFYRRPSDPSLYIRTLRHSVKVRNIRRYPQVTLIVDQVDQETAPEPGFIRIESAIIEGECEVIESIADLPEDLFALLFSEVATTPDSPQAAQLKASRVVLKITPQRVRYQRGKIREEIEEKQ
ncbi:MAG: hypothetical protein D6736_11785 [Nitrospinota bacterium]|nr:MAG: hypothetical protein D6736_11785 [Nitrospinota bacterium]